MQALRAASIAAATIVVMLTSLSCQANDDISPFQIAAASCQSFQTTCAARCKQRAPNDRNCVSDHCTPKLNQCRSTGCWQEGQMYGGKLTCGLTKS